MLQLSFEGIDPKVAAVLEELVSQLTALWGKEHNGDGSHGGRDGIGILDQGIGDDVDPTRQRAGGITIGGPATINQYRCRLAGNTPQAIATGVGASIQWKKPVSPTGSIDNYYDNGNPNFITNNADTLVRMPPVTGLYLVIANIHWTGDAAGSRYAELTHSGGVGTIARDGYKVGNALGNTHWLVAVVPVPYQSGDNQNVNVSVDVWQNTGAPLNIDLAWIQVTKIA